MLGVQTHDNAEYLIEDVPFEVFRVISDPKGCVKTDDLRFHKELKTKDTPGHIHLYDEVTEWEERLDEDIFTDPYDCESRKAVWGNTNSAYTNNYFDYNDPKVCCFNHLRWFFDPSICS